VVAAGAAGLAAGAAGAQALSRLTPARLTALVLRK